MELEKFLYKFKIQIENVEFFPKISLQSNFFKDALTIIF